MEKLKEIERWDINEDQCLPNPEGDWVAYEDHKTLIQSLQTQLKAENKELKDKVNRFRRFLNSVNSPRIVNEYKSRFKKYLT